LDHARYRAYFYNLKILKLKQSPTKLIIYYYRLLLNKISTVFIHKQHYYSVQWPLTAITAAHCLDNKCTRYWTVSRLADLLLSTFLKKTSHKFSMGFKSGPATVRSWCESALWISSLCSLYSKEHDLAGRQMLLPHHKVKNLKTACGSLAHLHTGPAAWPLEHTCIPRPSGSTLRASLCGCGCLYSGVYLSSTLLHTIAEKLKGTLIRHSTVSHCCTI